jgi:hypothetical protein
MSIVPLDAAHLFDLYEDILGWLLADVQPLKQHPRHNHDPFFAMLYQLFLSMSLQKVWGL